MTTFLLLVFLCNGSPGGGCATLMNPVKFSIREECEAAAKQVTFATGFSYSVGKCIARRRAG